MWGQGVLPFPVPLRWAPQRERDLTEGREDDLQCEILPEENGGKIKIGCFFLFSGRFEKFPVRSQIVFVLFGLSLCCFSEKADSSSVKGLDTPRHVQQLKTDGLCTLQKYI